MCRRTDKFKIKVRGRRTWTPVLVLDVKPCKDIEDKPDVFVHLSVFEPVRFGVNLLL